MQEQHWSSRDRRTPQRPGEEKSFDRRFHRIFFHRGRLCSFSFFFGVWLLTFRNVWCPFFFLFEVYWTISLSKSYETIGSKCQEGIVPIQINLHAMLDHQRFTPLQLSDGVAHVAHRLVLAQRSAVARQPTGGPSWMASEFTQKTSDLTGRVRAHQSYGMYCIICINSINSICIRYRTKWYLVFFGHLCFFSRVFLKRLRLFDLNLWPRPSVWTCNDRSEGPYQWQNASLSEGLGDWQSGDSAGCGF